MATISRRIADWAAGARYEDLSDGAVRAAKTILYDSLGCALGGFRTEDVGIMRAYLEAKGGADESTVIGSGVKLPAVEAALLNALMVRALDYNDIYWVQDPSHPSDIIPGPLALGERLRRSGRDLLLAIAIGHEVEMRLCEAAFPGIRERKWHHATLTAFAAPYACGRMMKLSGEQIAHAAGISGSRHATLGAITAGRLTMMKNTADPLATQSGVFAAELAARGYQGPEHVIDGKEGLFDAFGPEWKGGLLTDGLGESWRIERCGLKAFPTEALTHAPLTAVIELVEEHDLRPDQIETIHVKTIGRAADILSDPSKYDPRTRESADHSLPYCIAVAVVDRKVVPASFNDDRLFDDSVRAQLRKIEVTAEPAFERMFPAKQPNEVTITTRDGGRYVRYIEYPMGHPSHPIPQPSLEAKFRSLAEGVLSADRQRAVKQTVDGLESVADIGELTARIVSDR